MSTTVAKGHAHDLSRLELGSTRSSSSDEEEESSLGTAMPPYVHLNDDDDDDVDWNERRDHPSIPVLPRDEIPSNDSARLDSSASSSSSSSSSSEDVSVLVLEDSSSSSSSNNCTTTVQDETGVEEETNVEHSTKKSTRPPPPRRAYDFSRLQPPRVTHNDVDDNANDADPVVRSVMVGRVIPSSGSCTDDSSGSTEHATIEWTEFHPSVMNRC